MEVLLKGGPHILHWCIYVPLTCIERVNLSMSLHFHKVCIYPCIGSLWKFEKAVRENHTTDKLLDVNHFNLYWKTCNPTDCNIIQRNTIDDVSLE